MKKALAVPFCAMALALSLSSAGGARPFRVAMVTSPVSWNEEAWNGARALVERHGDVGSGGSVRHVELPRWGFEEPDQVIATIEALTADPSIGAIVVSEAFPGTAEAFRRVRAKRPDIILLVAESYEDEVELDRRADLVAALDDPARAYLLAATSARLGAKTFVHVSFPRHMAVEWLSRRRDAIARACSELGVRFVDETGADPISDLGTAGAQKYLLDVMPRWIEKYGKDTVFFTTSDALVEPMLRRAIEGKAMSLGADIPSLLVGYPGALGISVPTGVDRVAFAKRIEGTLVARKLGGRFGAWVWDYGFASVAGLGEFAARLLAGSARIDDLAALRASIEAYTPGASWSCRRSPAAASSGGSESVGADRVHLCQDTYVFGIGYMRETELAVPETYLIRK